MENKTKENLVWVDLEMTGLDVNKEHIIEMACLVTDKNLDPLCEGLNIVIHQPDHILDAMGEWCTKHHGESGMKYYFSLKVKNKSFFRYFFLCIYPVQLISVHLVHLNSNTSLNKFNIISLLPENPAKLP